MSNPKNIFIEYTLLCFPVGFTASLASLLTEILGLNAKGFRSKVFWIAAFLHPWLLVYIIITSLTLLFKHETQWQPTQ